MLAEVMAPVSPRPITAAVSPTYGAGNSAKHEHTHRMTSTWRICGPTVAARNDQGGMMKKTIWTGVVTGIAGLTTAAAITAQTPAAPQSSTASAERRMTVTG